MKKKINLISIDNWENLIPDDLRRDTNKHQVFIFEFFDYECPFCGTLETILDTIKLKYNEKVKIIRYHFPLNIHPMAYKAAIAAECAGIQNYFDIYHKVLMKNQYKLSSINFIEIAKKINLNDIDIEKFQICIEKEETADIIAKAVLLAKNYKVIGTPTIIINNKMISGVVNSIEIEKIINEFL
jgi:protein-disulfide isomerase